MRLLIKSAVVLPLLLAFWETRAQSQDSDARLTQLEKLSTFLGRQLMLQQLYVEEKTRSEGDSGLKQTRISLDGTKTYHTATHTDQNFIAAIHDHSNHFWYLGMGELIAVLNGVEFRTRHNDFKIWRPSTTSGQYGREEPIPFPDVPPAVLQQKTVEGQIKEMREWFKAWRDQDPRRRDYRPYFRPVLIYLEGAWTTSKELQEPFQSDRHKLDASSWYDLQEKVRFTSYTGDMHNDQNLAYMPTTIMNITNGIPRLAQWNFRILGHRLNNELSTRHLKPVDNLANRMARNKTFEEYIKSRAARFTVNHFSNDRYLYWSLLDDMMYQIPGKDNYRANISGSTFKLEKLNFKVNLPLNAGFYHRWFKVRQKNAMGRYGVHKGFADRNLFVAETTQPQIAPFTFKSCDKIRDPLTGRWKTVCEEITTRVSYAIPLEIVWMTPLQSWNPYNLAFWSGRQRSFVKANGRNGGHTAETAFNGTKDSEYYLTPASFFSGREVDKDKADTTRGTVGVLDQDGQVRFMKAAGIRIFLPEISGVGVLRTRYPIMPVHVEGSPIWKELEALRDMMMDVRKYMTLFENPPALQAGTSTKSIPQVELLEMSNSPDEPIHAHYVGLNRDEYLALTRDNKVLNLTSSTHSGHSHELSIKYDSHTNTFRYVLCDGKEECFDRHPKELNALLNG